MTLKDINDANLLAMKNKDIVARALFSTLKGAIETELKSSKKTEDDIIKTLAKKFTENAKIINTIDSLKEIELLKSYLPLELDINEYESIINNVISNNIGVVNEIKAGNKPKLGFLTGCCMKEANKIANGKSVDPKLINQLLNDKISN